MQGDDPPFLSVSTEVSAKYKGAFCEAKIRKVVRNIKCKVTFKQGLGTATVTDEQIKGALRVGITVEARHPDKREFVEATITKIQDCSQYTVVFDDGDITTLRRSALCLKSGRHFNESETLDQLPLTHPEHFGNPVIGGRRGRRRHLHDDSSEEEEDEESARGHGTEKEEHIGKVVCVETSESKKRSPKETWFPGLVVAPTAQDTVRIRVRDEYLVRSFKDGRYYTVPKKEATEFTRELSARQDAAVIAALQYLDNDDLPPHWDREALFGLSASSNSDSDDGMDTDISDDEPIEEKDHFVAQLYKFMDDRGTPLNRGPVIATKDVDLYRFFRVVQKYGGYTRVTSQNQWKTIAVRLGFSPPCSIAPVVRQSYYDFLLSFEEFYRKLGCTMNAHQRGARTNNKGRSLIRKTPTPSPRSQDTPPADIVEEPEKKNEKQRKTVKREDSEPQSSKTKTQKQTIEKKLIKEKVEDRPSCSTITSVDTESSSQSETATTSEYVEVETTKPVVKLKKAKEEVKECSEQKTPVKPKRKQLGNKVKTLVDKYEEKTKPDKDKKQEDKMDTKEKNKAVAGEDESSSQSQNTRSKSKEHTKAKKDSTASTEKKISKEVKDKDRDQDKEPKEKIKEREKEKLIEKEKEKDKDTDKERTKEKLKEKDRGEKSKDKDKKDKKPVEDDKKRGRRRKDTEASSDKQDNTPTTAEPTATKIFTVEVGDKLKVYYHESEVTYEAKVIEIDNEQPDRPMYLVHYTGWNTRYDEWVHRDRIASNLSASTKAKRLKTGNQPSKVTTSSSSSSSSSSKPQAAKRGRGPSTAGRPPNDQSSAPPRSTTPSSVTSSSSRTKSPATPANRRITRQHEILPPGRSTRRRRTSGLTDMSLIDSSSESEDISDVDVTESKHLKQGTSKTGSDDSSNKTADVKKGKRKILEKSPTKRQSENISIADIKKSIKKMKKEEEVSEDEPLQQQQQQQHHSKGRDFDLNQIRSELKGFKEVLKVSSPEAEKVEANDPCIFLNDDTAPVAVKNKSTVLSQPSTSAASTSSEKRDVIKEVQIKMEETEVVVKLELTPEKFMNINDNSDIYEFKEPEPFEFEVRKPSSEEKKKRPTGRIFEDITETKTEKSLKRKTSTRGILSECRKVKKIKKDLTDDDSSKDDDIEIIIEPPVTPPKRTVSDEVFDKLRKSPSFNLSKSSNSPLDYDDTPNLLEEPLSIFETLGNTEDSGDKLIMSDTEDVIGNEEPLSFTYQQELFPISDEKTSTLLPMFAGITELSKIEEKIKEKIRPIVKTDSSSDDDAIEATIKRVISQSLSDESFDETNEPQTSTREETDLLFAEPKIIKTETQVVEDTETPLLVEIQHKSPEIFKQKTEVKVIVAEDVRMDIDLPNMDNESGKELAIFEVKQPQVVTEIKSTIVDKVLKAIKESPVVLESDSNSNSNIELIETPKIKAEEEIPIIIIPPPKPEGVSEVKKELKIENIPIIIDPPLKIIQKKIELPVQEVKLDEAEIMLVIPPPQQKNTILDTVIHKLESAIQQSTNNPVSAALSSNYIDDYDDSTDSEERLVIDKLSEDESHLSEDNSQESPEKKLVEDILNITSNASKSNITIDNDKAYIYKTEEIKTEIKSEKSEENESNISLLLCEETIPGSPAPLSTENIIIEPVPKAKPKSAKNLQMELPFASAVSISNKQSASKPKDNCNIPVKLVNTNANITNKSSSSESFVQPNPIIMGTPKVEQDAAPLDNSAPNTPESTISNLSPREDRVISPLDARKARDSSSMELDSGAENPSVMAAALHLVSVSKRSPAIGSLTPMGGNHGGISEDDSRTGMIGMKKLDLDRENISPKKRRRSRKVSEREENSGKRIRRTTHRVTSDSDTSEPAVRDHRMRGETNILKYNFFVQLDPALDSNQKIGILQQKLSDLKKTYHNVKAELACIDRRRKKLRRREREVVKAAKMELVV